MQAGPWKLLTSLKCKLESYSCFTRFFSKNTGTPTYINTFGEFYLALFTKLRALAAISCSYKADNIFFKPQKPQYYLLAPRRYFQEMKDAVRCCGQVGTSVDAFLYLCNFFSSVIRIIVLSIKSHGRNSIRTHAFTNTAYYLKTVLLKIPLKLNSTKACQKFVWAAAVKEAFIILMVRRFLKR